MTHNGRYSGVPTCRTLYADKVSRTAYPTILKRQTFATPRNVTSGEGGSMDDLWQFIDEIDADKQAMLARRLEDRAQMPKFVEIRESYFEKIGLPVRVRVLELG